MACRLTTKDGANAGFAGAKAGLGCHPSGRRCAALKIAPGNFFACAARL